MLELGVLDYGARWFALSLCFFFLIHVFGDRMHIEGALGYLLPLFVIIPVNVLAHIYVRSLASFTAISSIPPPSGFEFLPIVGMLVVINFALMFVTTKILPAISASSVRATFVFAFFLSALSYSLWLVPPLPPILGFDAAAVLGSA